MSENLADVCRYLSHGVYVVGVASGELRHAFTAAWVMQVSFNPLLLAISINPAHYSYQVLQAGGVCTVNVLGQHQYALAEHFGRSGVTDKMAGFNWHTDQSGAPVLSESLAYFDCKVSHYTDAGDHKVAICTVLAARQLQHGSPLLYGQTGTMDGSEKFYQDAK
ncbi:flavin reductase family protein [Crenothrix polyspora]|uniref:Flavin reductase domain FMN-binding protein n=1 Tax=Crenothrix polyspora TaxID=360316 RepID=A0A1R4H7A9_9GAMM|nr:flavin reductase family protein [Crenothrix polyspora]SJM91911.1 Flavin reductase domain FMN-binding protein [Crenothrix polyspora]